MSRKVLLALIVAGVVGMVLPTLDMAQSHTHAPPAKAESSTKKNEAAKAPAQLPLEDLTFISTSEAAREAAKAAKEKAEGRDASKSGEAADGGILEFQPVKSGGPARSGPGDAHQKRQKRPLLKDVHGSAYGAAAGSGTTGHTTAGDVGARSRNGKVNVFVETEHSRTTQPGPQ